MLWKRRCCVTNIAYSYMDGSDLPVLANEWWAVTSPNRITVSYNKQKCTNACGKGSKRNYVALQDKSTGFLNWAQTTRGKYSDHIWCFPGTHGLEFQRRIIKCCLTEKNIMTCQQPLVAFQGNYVLPPNNENTHTLRFRWTPGLRHGNLIGKEIVLLEGVAIDGEQIGTTEYSGQQYHWSSPLPCLAAGCRFWGTLHTRRCLPFRVVYLWLDLCQYPISYQRRKEEAQCVNTCTYNHHCIGGRRRATNAQHTFTRKYTRLIVYGR